MRLINRCCSSFSRLPSSSSFGIQDQQIRLAIAVMLGHLALFQLVDASTQSTSSSVAVVPVASAAAIAKMSLPFGNGSSSKYALPKGRCRGQDVISLVPEKDRGLFVFYHLAKALSSTSSNKNITLPRINIEPGIPKKQSEAFKNILTYDTFSADLLKWTMQTFEWSQFDVSNNLLLRRYQRKLCTPKGWCFNPIDIGNICCPF